MTRVLPGSIYPFYSTSTNTEDHGASTPVNTSDAVTDDGNGLCDTGDICTEHLQEAESRAERHRNNWRKDHR